MKRPLAFSAALGAAFCGFATPAHSQTSSAGPAWTRGAVCYEVFVRSFYDSNGDGIGDLKGLTSKLGYIDSLGASCIWIMPIAKSPSYHGYDVADYYTVDPAYGTNADFQHLVAAAHRRGIKVIVDMVLNHSSSQHPYFQAALRDTASPYRSWYIFSPTDGGKGPWGAPAWRKSPVRDEYYYGLFSAEMPDLDYHNPAVRAEGKKIADYWLKEMGVDGFRLDAVQYLVEDGPCQRDCAGTHAYLHEYGAHIDSVSPGAYTVGEVWDNIGTILTYYPDQLSSYFMFPLADSLRLALQRGSAGGLLASYHQLQDSLPDWRWSPILSNHDGTRIMTSLGGDMARARVAATLLLTLPGLPYVYYGEEIGMTGDKPDPRLRTPMQWKPGKGVGFTTGTAWESPQPDSATTNVAREETEPGSLLHLYRSLINLRRHNEALATGRLVPLTTENTQVVAYLRRAGSHAVLVVANLGATPASDIWINSETGAMPPGRYPPRSLVGGPVSATFTVNADGRVQGYHPVGTLAPGQSLVLDLVRRR
jgi:alpha-amylase